MDAQAETVDGSVWTIDPAAMTLDTSRSPSGIERRAVLEFSLAALPEDAVITHVDVALEVAGLTYSDPDYPVLEFRGYPGDGILTVSDATVAAPLVGVSAPVTSLNDAPVVALDAGFVQSLIGSASHLGLYTFQQTLGRQMAFYATEFAEVFPVSAAVLTIEYELPIGHGGLLPITDRRDLIWDAKRNLLYITTAGGTIERFDATTRSMLEPFDLGVPLNGADITPDGAFLYVASGNDGLADASIRKVDLDTGIATVLTFSYAFGEAGRWDIKIANNGIGLITSRFGGSGWVPVRSIDVATDVVTEREDVPGSSQHNVRGGAKLVRSHDRSTIFLDESGSGSRIILYNASDDTFPLWAEGAFASNGVDSASPDGGLFIRNEYLTTEVRNRLLEVVGEIGDYDAGTAITGGTVFHPELPLVFVADEHGTEIVAFSVPGLDEQYRMDIGESPGVALAFDSGTMAMSHTGLLLFLSTPDGVRVYDIPHPGTDDCDGNGIRDICDIDCGASDLLTGLPCAEGASCGTASDCTGNAIPDRCEPDCNTNRVPDPCETSSGMTPDCNSNLVPDSCEGDCNFNGIADECDVTGGTSDDCDHNGLPDECQGDCNANGQVDACEVLTDPSLDEDHNGLIDACQCDAEGEQIVRGVSVDEFDQFGFGVALSGSLAVVGSQGDSMTGPPPLAQAGAAYVYELVEGVWSERWRLTADPAAAGDLFGYSVAVAGGTVFVGAPSDGDFGVRAGALYVFQRDGDTLAQVQVLRPADIAPFDLFGVSVAVSGEWLWVGAMNEGNSGVPETQFDGAGAVYAFRKEGAVWVERAKLAVAESNAVDFFGSSVALDGTVGVIGALGRDDACPEDANCNSGAAYVFRRTGDITWMKATKLAPSELAAGDEFGVSLAMVGNEILVGATRADAPETADTGAGYLYIYGGVDSVAFAGKLAVPLSQSHDNYGRGVAFDRDIIVLGGPNADGVTGSSGAAALFVRRGTEWRYEGSIEASDGRSGYRFATAVAVDGDRGLIGGPGRFGRPPVPGAAYFYNGLISCLPPPFQRDTVPDLVDCLGGPRAHPAPTIPGLDRATCLLHFDPDGDRDVDIDDVSLLWTTLDMSP